VPQDPTLFEAALRFNLDPTGARSDADMMHALQRVSLGPKGKQSCFVLFCFVCLVLVCLVGPKGKQSCVVLVWFVWFVWFVWIVWFVWFVCLFVCLLFLCSLFSATNGIGRAMCRRIVFHRRKTGLFFLC
jgi:hypothetical protein